MNLNNFNFKSEIDFDLLKSNFQTEWINELDNIITTYVDTYRGMNNKTYFYKPGNYDNRNEKKTPREISDYFKRTLYAPNIYILDFVCKNIDFFRNQIFLDNGAGMGVLSVYLKKLGVVCFNYDDFSQIREVVFDTLVEIRLSLKIERVTNIVPNKFDVLTSSGIGIMNPIFLNQDIKLIMVDSRYDLDSNHTNKGIIKELVSNDNVLKYSDLSIYLKK